MHYINSLVTVDSLSEVSGFLCRDFLLSPVTLKIAQLNTILDHIKLYTIIIMYRGARAEEIKLK